MDNPSSNLSTIRKWLSKSNYAPILEAAKNRKGILSQLTALSYDEDAEISEHAIEATGLAARIIAKRDPEYVRNYLLRLFWLINDESGGIGWRAPELIGEILYHCPQFSQFFPMVISLLDMEKEDAPRFQAGTLWAIGRIAQATKNAMLPALPQVRALISEDKPIGEDVKAKVLWCIQQLTAAEI
ncbi:MAG: DVU0298 family protein [Anaerolineales bacterium]